jgi:lipopolysaccharide export system protein LptA
MTRGLIAAAFLAVATAAHADSTVSMGKHNTNAPIHIDAAQFTADKDSRSGTWSGNVIVTQGDMKLRSDSMRVQLVGDKPDKIIAHGNVVFTSASSGTATGDNAVYDVGPRFITFTGRVILTKDKNVMRGTNLRVNLVTGQATLNAVGSTLGGGRVQGIFTPPPQANNSASPSP